MKEKNMGCGVIKNLVYHMNIKFTQTHRSTKKIILSAASTCTLFIERVRFFYFVMQQRRLWRHIAR